MPGINAPSGQYLVNYLNDLDRRLNNLERQQTFIVVDNAGRPRAQLGLLPNLDYGLRVIDPDGTGTLVSPTSSSYSAATLQTASTTPVTLSGAPALDVYLGHSGDALVEVGAFIETPAANATGTVYLTVNSNAAQQALVLGDTAGSVAGNVFTRRVLSQWLPNYAVANADNTFTLQFSSLNGTTTFGALVLTVTPL
jgi:hypothetical protein